MSVNKLYKPNEIRTSVLQRTLSLQYNPASIEKKWQEEWDKAGVYSPNLHETKQPYYNLMMFPYPSGEGLHVGNMYAFTGSDIWGRFQRMKGNDVFEPIGLDGFGIHSENYAIKIGAHPMTQAKVTEKRFYEQLRATGNGFDWGHILETYDPDYYRWTQWVFVQMFKHGLAYRKKAEVNWCPSCKTVLADEQVINGKCERCSSEVEKRQLEQWFFRITAYADRLLENLDKIDWSEKVKIAQRNWIGKKEGIEIDYQIEGSNEKITVFTTRPDTNFGATFIVLAPEHALAQVLASKAQNSLVEKYIKTAKSKSAEDRIKEGKEKTGVFTGSFAINNLTGKKMPIWISDFVLSSFGTGAVVGVPGHDIRDFEFAKKFDLPIIRVVVGSDGDTSEIVEAAQVQEDEGKMINSGFLDGLDIHEATQKIMDFLEEKAWGRRETTYHLRDWLISRQRYWGPPIPMIYCHSCESAAKGEREDMPGWYSVPVSSLPVELPFIENFKPTGTGEAPLAQDKNFVNVKCPGCGEQARRETDVSDTFLDSAWYFLRYPSVSENSKHEALSTRQLLLRRQAQKLKSKNSKSLEIRNLELEIPWDPEITRRWLPVHMYIGGAEHSVLHLLYSRFVTMALNDWGLINFEEPFTRFYAHGLLIKDGAKMSKSKGNVIIPDEYIKKFGADTLRTYLMFLGPFNQGGDFRDSGIEGMFRFMNRVWKLVQKPISNDQFPISNEEKRVIHTAIKRVTEDLTDLRYNRGIAGIMEYVNSLETFDKISTLAVKTLLQLLAPFSPHITEELWEKLGQKESIHVSQWPEHDEKLIQTDTVSIAIQVNGRLRGTISVPSVSDSDREFVEKRAREDEHAAKYITSEPKKVIFVPGKLINFVV